MIIDFYAIGKIFGTLIGIGVILYVLKYLYDIRPKKRAIKVVA